MLPTIVMNNKRVESVMGSGGSKRIRTAILQVLINMIDFHFPLREAIETARVHLEDGIVQAEPDIPAAAVKRLRSYHKVNVWSRKDMYFGGVHTVSGDMEGWGDSRRGGNFQLWS